jgi:hypothetical protein
VATDLRLTHHETRPGDGDRLAYEQVWATADRTSAINYLEDPISGLHYLSIRGTLASRLVTKLAKRLDVYDEEDLLEHAATATTLEEQVRALNQVAIGFVDYHPAAMELLEGYATSAPLPQLRAAAVNAMGFRAWPQFRPVLEQVAAQDPDEGVRRRAASMLPFVPPPQTGG